MWKQIFKKQLPLVLPFTKGKWQSGFCFSKGDVWLEYVSKRHPDPQNMCTKKYSHPDDFFCSTSLQPLVVKCEVQAQSRPTSTDHFPIVTHIDLPQTQIPLDPSFNFRAANWHSFKWALTVKVDLLPKPGPLTSTHHLTTMGKQLTQASNTRHKKGEYQVQQATARCKKMVEQRHKQDAKRAQQTNIRLLQL